MLDVGCGECIEADLSDGSCSEAGLALVLINKEGVFLFIFKPANEGGRGFDRGLIGSGRGPVLGLVGANAPTPSLCFIDIPPPPEVDSERDWAWGLGCCEIFIAVDDALAAVLIFCTGDERLLMRGISGDDGAENKDVGESARGRVSFTRLLFTGHSRRMYSAPLRPYQSNESHSILRTFVASNCQRSPHLQMAGKPLFFSFDEKAVL